MLKQDKTKRNLVLSVPLLGSQKIWKTPIVVGVLLPTHARASAHLAISAHMECRSAGIFTTAFIEIRNGEKEDIFIEKAQAIDASGNIYENIQTHTRTVKGGNRHISVGVFEKSFFVLECPAFIGTLRIAIKAYKAGETATWFNF